MKETILVTGGLGYIGSHTVVALLQASYNVVIIDNLSNAEYLIYGQVKKITGKSPEFYLVDVCEPLAVQDILTKHSPSVVIHFAAFKSVAESVNKPLKYFQNNLVSLMSLLQAMSTCKIKNLVFSSSATVYGTPLELPVTENSPLQKPLSAYGSTKQIGEDILERLTDVNQLRAISLRYFNPVGAHSSGLLGELPRGIPNNLFPFVMRTGKGKLPLLTVFGDNYDTPDGSCIRDYIHVVDLARAHVYACNSLLSGNNKNNYSIYNVGTGKGTSVFEVIKAFNEITGVKLNFSVGPPRAGDAPCVYADASKAFHELGWKAELDIDEMVRSAWQWETNLDNIMAGHAV